jgi:hypothetical protein
VEPYPQEVRGIVAEGDLAPDGTEVEEGIANGTSGLLDYG